MWIFPKARPFYKLQNSLAFYERSLLKLVKWIPELDDFPDEKFQQKLKMCLENKRVFDIVDPGYSTSRGQLLYEIPESFFQVNKRTTKDSN